MGATHNTSGIRGVANNIQIVPINIFWGGESDSDLAASINWAWSSTGGNADVLCNSWNFENSCSMSKDVITSAINNARTKGRNGRGCLVVFSSGNKVEGEDVNDCIRFPARINGVMTVGAVGRTGVLANYSKFGTELELVAPSSITTNTPDMTTTDLNGTTLVQFGGTSAACPQVAGIAALWNFSSSWCSVLHNMYVSKISLILV
ncbi:MAG: hypothetical protein OHK0038_24590 [Flammeovirgaceae bacterium]